MSVELGTVLTIIAMIVAMVVFYFTQMRAFDSKLSDVKDELQAEIISTKDANSREFTDLKVAQAQHGTRLTNVENFAHSINSRVNGHVNGKHA